MKNGCVRVFLIVSVCLALGQVESSTRQRSHHLVTLTALTTSDIRKWDVEVDHMRRTGGLHLVRARADAELPGYRHERFEQFHNEVRIFGGDVTRQTADGVTISVFGSLYADIAVDTEPTLSAEAVKSLIERLGGAELGPDRLPELVILPTDGGEFALAYTERVASDADLIVYFVDAHTGRVLFTRSDLRTQSAVGNGRGVLGDTKKISASRVGSTYVTDDRLRPPALTTLDMRGNLARVQAYLNGTVNFTVNDMGADGDNEWTDGANVDAHVYMGWTYDYLFKRFGRRGLDNSNVRIVGVTHPVRREEFNQHPVNIRNLYFANAFYASGAGPDRRGVMVFGEGLPPGIVPGRTVEFLAGAIDVVAHELTHGVTDYSSGLIYQNESGALNEAFSDIIGTGAEFFFQQAGNGPMRADYLLGEDVFVPGGIRSMSNPAAFNDPDHYSRRFLGTADNGGVHTNSGIANHAFYLAIEGGTNRTSGLAVQGVGGNNREQIERVFYRAFTEMLIPNATFAMARAATIQSARDLYGVGSAAERAVTQAWTAVGVQ